MTPASTVRLFIALLPDAGVRDELAAWRDAWTWPRAATPVKTGRLHVTLHFLGDVERSRVQELAGMLRVPFTPFTLRLTLAALWPHGIAVLEPAEVPGSLLALHASLAGVVRDFGLAVDERPFRPHVTLARRASAVTPPGLANEVRWPVTNYALMSSTLGANGTYTTYP
jgi:RNA 2',3'-cyclic 3'-phosphodiesterase